MASRIGPQASASDSPPEEAPSKRPAGGAEGPKKRNRIRYSCMTCRDKKLKCNKARPACDQCIRRGISSTCRYVPYLYPKDSPRSILPTLREGKSPQSENLADRMKYLEQANLALRRKLEESGLEIPPAANNPLAFPRGRHTSRLSKGPETPGDLTGVVEPPAVGPLVGEMRYVDAANWEAIMQDVTKQFGEDMGIQTDDDEDFEPDESFHKEGPVLLLGFGTFSSSTSEHLPPRHVTDQLIARFFQGKEPAWLMFHVPTFQKQYHDFWEDPDRYPVTFIGLLCIMIAHAAFFALRGDEEIPGNLGSPAEVKNEYRIKAAHCLALGDFTSPGKYKVETLILYFGIEYFGAIDAQRGTSIIMSIIVRLAMHMGLHRDPKHYDGMSIFESEMRRRLWTLLTEIDILISFQFGLPSNVQLRYFDTGLPKNLNDEDFDEETTKWPVERPFSERTPALYTIVKSRIVVAFGDILATVTSSRSPTYGEVLRLNQKLEDAYEAIPPLLRMKPFDLSVTDPIDLIMQRLWIELMYQKARIVLHRRYFAIGRTDSRYTNSRFHCIESATITIQHQFDIHNQMLKGGRLSKERWFLSSLSTHDFLLANMILCLELSHLVQNPDGPPESQTINKDQLINIIRTSRHIWNERRKESTEANRAFKILSLMLSSATGTHYDASSPEGEDGMRAEYPANLAREHIRQKFGSGLVTPQNALESQWALSEDATMQPVEDSAPGLDWANWDVQIQNANAEAETTDLPWNNFFPRQ